VTAQYPGALWAPSPNYSRGRREPVRLIDSGRNGESVGIEHVARTPGELGEDDAGLPLTEALLHHNRQRHQRYGCL